MRFVCTDHRRALHLARIRLSRYTPGAPKRNVARRRRAAREIRGYLTRRSNRDIERRAVTFVRGRHCERRQDDLNLRAVGRPDVDFAAVAVNICDFAVDEMVDSANAGNRSRWRR